MKLLKIEVAQKDLSLDHYNGHGNQNLFDAKYWQQFLHVF